MSTSTLERVDWATCMDETPACESFAASGEPGSHIARLSCGCMALLCPAHVDSATQRLAAAMLYGVGVQCAACDTRLPGRSLSDVLTVVPL